VSSRYACERELSSHLTYRFLINDTYRTDVHLLYPPYIIALAVLYIGFCLTAMNNATSTRTRSSSSQLQTLASSLEINTALGLPPPPPNAAEFIASFEVSMPVLLACVQDIIVLYPMWETFEPSQRAGGASATSGAAGSSGAFSGDKVKESFGVEEAEALVRRMIQERMVDVGHPDNAGAQSSGTAQVVGKKRKA
jgi:cyclin C